MQDAGAYQNLYDNAATSTWPAEGSRPDWDLISRYILEQRPKGQGSNVLDFGCFTGGLLARLGSVNRRYGVEINRSAAAVAAAKISGAVWPCIEDIPGNLRFDIVVASDVIEHMANPMNLIEKLSKVMSEDGVLIITTGDADNRLWNRFGANWWYCFYPEHVAFVSKAWLDFLCKTTSLTLNRCVTFRYCALSPVRNLIHGVLMYWYGWHPASYLFLAGLFRTLLGRAGISSVAGNGVSRDHLFIVLTKLGSRERREV
jgi:SAM-dependent methyltransferase